jgi:hypothetical protein
LINFDNGFVHQNWNQSIKRGNICKKSPPWHSWTSNCVCKYQMFIKNRTSRILSKQVTFFR